MWNEDTRLTYQDMELAVTAFKRYADRDQKALTADFWDAVAVFAPKFLIGDFSMTKDTSTGDVTIRFIAKK